MATEDAKAAALIYRDVREYAVGHNCSAEWDPEGGVPQTVRTSWLPFSLVRGTSTDGHPVFQHLDETPNIQPLSAHWLSNTSDNDLFVGLARLTDAYSEWIEGLGGRLEEICGTINKVQAEAHIERCNSARLRMVRGIDLVKEKKEVRDAFRLANRAMMEQFAWAPETHGELAWRPFQIAFALMVLPSIIDQDDENRLVADLLWFPTGGGKTEAYLLLSAFAIFLRRLRHPGSTGGGVTVFMRYTLRLLTIQQFQRAAAMICACELLRLGKIKSDAVDTPKSFESDPPVSLGLWVGRPSSPNEVTEAAEALRTGDDSSPAQLRNCPCCGRQLDWKLAPGNDAIWASCNFEVCDLASVTSHLPVWTVDEDIYRELPSLLVATADKYAQIVRKQETGRLFGIGTDAGPPELIVQDELHLISGPLGTLAGIYEIAVDELCSRNGSRPKIIGSTATIRRAEEQILSLFCRRSFQFPPPGLDYDDSGFAVSDPDGPGRLYVGVTTAGRSAKFTLQAVSASLLQAASDPSLAEADRDWYWTLVVYFNSLRELGGAVVLMQDDVHRSVNEYARRREEVARTIEAPIELTSRVESSQIPLMLDQLKRGADSGEAVDVVLASNMISVGVDIGRLGIMIVNGQPKGIAEYIQSTSRVGRGKVPGLVLSIYNANKARDRSHFESFCSWHQALYKEVEATSVTPFAPRARDRALHASLVAISRHLLPALAIEPVDIHGSEIELGEVVDRIVERAAKIDKDEEDAVRDYST